MRGSQPRVMELPIAHEIIIYSSNISSRYDEYVLIVSGVEALGTEVAASSGIEGAVIPCSWYARGRSGFEGEETHKNATTKATA